MREKQAISFLKDQYLQMRVSVLTKLIKMRFAKFMEVLYNKNATKGYRSKEKYRWLPFALCFVHKKLKKKRHFLKDFYLHAEGNNNCIYVYKDSVTYSTGTNYEHQEQKNEILRCTISCFEFDGHKLINTFAEVVCSAQSLIWTSLYCFIRPMLETLR